MNSPFQYRHAPDGTITLAGLPNVRLEMIEEQGHVTGRNWQHELELPTYQEEWEAMAQARRMSLRHVRFVVMDESASRLPGHTRLCPKTVVLPPQGCALELGHTGFVIGFVHAFITGFDELRSAIPSLFGFEIPPPAPEGDFIVGTARLFESPLAEKTWQGLQQGIFTHVCPMTFVASPSGRDTLVQVTLTTGDYAGCPGARILTTWEG